MQSDLVGAHAMGLRNVLLTTGNPAPQGTLRRRDVGVRRRRDRPDEHGRAAQPRARHRRAVDRRAHAVPHRRGGQSVRAEPGRRMAPARAQGRGRRRVHRDAADPRPRRVRRRAAAAARPRACRSSPASPRSRACGTPSSSRAKSSACASADALIDRLRRAADPAAEALAVTVEIARALRDRVQGVQITSRPRLAGDDRAAARWSCRRRALGPDVGPAASHG